MNSSDPKIWYVMALWISKMKTREGGYEFNTDCQCHDHILKIIRAYNRNINRNIKKVFFYQLIQEMFVITAFPSKRSRLRLIIKIFYTILDL